MYTLRISPTIANEWNVRGIGDVIPELDNITFKAGTIMVTRATLREIAADCEFMSDPKAVDATPAERRAYRSMLEQCERLLSE